MAGACTNDDGLAVAGLVVSDPAWSLPGARVAFIYSRYVNRLPEVDRGPRRRVKRVPGGRRGRHERRAQDEGSRCPAYGRSSYMARPGTKSPWRRRAMMRWNTACWPSWKSSPRSEWSSSARSDNCWSHRAIREVVAVQHGLLDEQPVSRRAVPSRYFTCIEIEQLFVGWKLSHDARIGRPSAAPRASRRPPGRRDGGAIPEPCGPVEGAR